MDRSTLVDRLRVAGPWMVAPGTLAEAANELERLNGEVESLRKTLATTIMAFEHRGVGTYRDTVNKARAALKARASQEKE